IAARPRKPALVSDLYDDRQFTCPALRRREVCIAISAALIAVLGFAIFVHLSLLASMRPDVVSVFARALGHARNSARQFAVASRAAGAANAVVIRRRIPLGRVHRHRVRLAVQHRLPEICRHVGCASSDGEGGFGAECGEAPGGADFRTDRGGDRQGGGRARDLPVAAPRVPQRARRHRLWCARRSRWFEAALYVAQGYAEKGVAPLALQFGWRYAALWLGRTCNVDGHLRRISWVSRCERIADG